MSSNDLLTSPSGREAEAAGLQVGFDALDGNPRRPSDSATAPLLIRAGERVKDDFALFGEEFEKELGQRRGKSCRMAALRRAIEAVLTDEPRPGAPAKFTSEQVTQIWAVACEPPEKSGRPITHWTARELTDEVIQRRIVASISSSQVSRHLREAAVQPHKSRSWLNTTEKDPVRFEEQVKTVCDMYLGAPEQARTHQTHTVSVDEMTGLQALGGSPPVRR